MTYDLERHHAGETTAAPHDDFGPAGGGIPRLPTVSVVIVNWNYARYLGAAIASIFAQTYPHIECLIVDNGSTDHSAEVLADAARRHPTLRVLALAANEGQTAACVRALAATTGPYLIFLDADDMLLPHAVATHILVHLSSREHVGFTSGDMLQIVDDAIVLSTSDALNTAYRAAPADAELLRPGAMALEPIRRIAPADLGSKVRLVGPLQARWVWAPTSGNCFRRDALDLFFDGEGLERLKSQTDLFLALSVNAITGSIIIDEPVFAYRLHGANVFTNRPQLRGVLSFDTRLASGPADLAKRLILDQLTRHVGRFVQERWRGQDFFKHLKRLDVPPESGANLVARRSFAAACVAERFTAVAAAAGRPRTLLFLATRLPLSVLLSLISGRRSRA